MKTLLSASMVLFTAAILAASGVRAGEAAHYAVCVGVNEYDTRYVPRDNWLSGCVADAGNLWTNLTQRGEWAPAGATLLLDGAATKAAIRAAITNAAACAVPGDVFVYTHSSHGYSWTDNETGACTLDTGICAYDDDYEDSELAADLAKFPSGAKVVVFVDACHSAGLFKAKQRSRARTAAGLPSPAPFALAERVGAAIDAIRAAEPVRRGVKPKGISSSEIGWVTAADYNQYSWDYDSGIGGEFTMAAIEGWHSGLCDDAPCGDEDGYANFYELWNYAKDIAIGHEGEEEEEGENYRTDAQCANTNVLLSVRAGWAGDAPPPEPDDPPRLREIGDFEIDVGETVSFRVRAYAPEEAPVTDLYIAAGDPAATLEDGVFSFSPTVADDFEFIIVAENANGAASGNFTIAVYPAQPEAPTVEDVTSDSFGLRWTPAGGAKGYGLYVSRFDGSHWKKILTNLDIGDVTNFVVTDLTPDTKYRAKIAAYAEVDGEKRYSWDSDEVRVTTDRQHFAPGWSVGPVPTAQIGRPYRFDLVPFVSGFPEPVLTLAAGDATLEGAMLCFVPAAAGTNVFTVVASNELGTASATFKVAVGAFAPKKFAVCVGINEYMTISGLNGCVNDAKFMAANLEERGGWEPADVIVLLDSAATKAAIRGAISNIAAQALSGDTFVYQHSSHGGQFHDTTGDPITDETGKATFLCVYDEDYDDNTTAYNDYEIADDLAAFSTGVKVAVIVDACHSGGLFKSREAARAAAATFDLAGRVSARMDTVRARRRARGESVARSLSASEIGWAVAAEYYEYSFDGGFYHTDAWLSDPSYGEEWWGGGDYPDSYRMGGVFLCSSTWGWWSGDADADAEAGDGDGLCDIYEFWKRGSDFCTGIGTFWYDEPDYDFHPQCTNVTVLRSVELGWTAPPGDPIPEFPAGTAPERIASSLAGSADSALVEHVAGADTYSVYRAWAQTVKQAGGAAPAGAAAVRELPRAWFSFALGSDALLPDDFGSDDVRIAAFGRADDAGFFSLEVEIDGVDIGSSAAVPEETLLANLAEAFSVEGSETLDPDKFSPAGIEAGVDSPAGGRVRLEAAPPDDAGDAFFFRVRLQ